MASLAPQGAHLLHGLNLACEMTSSPLENHWLGSLGVTFPSAPTPLSLHPHRERGATSSTRVAVS